MALSLAVLAERHVSDCTSSLLFLKPTNMCSEILMNDFHIFSGFPFLTISWAATKLSQVVEFADFIHFLNWVLLISAFRFRSETARCLSSPPGYFSGKAVCLFRKCFSTFYLLLLASFWPQISHMGRPLSSEVNVNESAQAAVNVLFTSDIFFFFNISAY